MVGKVYRELMILGFISFGVVISNVSRRNSLGLFGPQLIHW